MPTWTRFVGEPDDSGKPLLNEGTIHRMNYTPHTEADIGQMLEAVGADHVDRLFDPIPEELRLEGLDLPKGVSEMEAIARLEGLAREIQTSGPDLCFIGAGAYDHFSPSVVDAVISRGEFFTAYTPYQPEVSQGTLRAIYEFQTMICELPGMEIANASMYDGSSALAEAVMMAARIRDAQRVLLPRSLHPYYRKVVEAYARGAGLKMVDVPWTRAGTMDLDALKDELDDDTTAVVVQNPNFLGVLEPLDAIGEIVTDSAASYVACVNPMSLGLIRPPGDFGADIVVGDGQPLGLLLSFGGPYVGFFATREAHVRKMPGRIVGQTTDVDGKRGYVLTLKTREQDIRRERATSNICTNQTLCATAVTVFLSSLGPQGLGEAAALNWAHSHQAADALATLDGVSLPFDGAFFNEFVVACDRPAHEVLGAMSSRGIAGGIDLGRFYPELDHHILTCVTEKRTGEEIDRLLSAWKEAV